MIVTSSLRSFVPQRPSASAAPAPEGNALPDLATISARAAATEPAGDATPEAPVQSGSWARTAGVAAMAAVAGIGALAATAAPAHADTRVGVVIGPNGVGVHVENYKNPWGQRGHRGHGGHNGGHQGHGHQHGKHYDNHGPYFTGIGKDGKFHRFDRYNHVNDATGHYVICNNPWTGGYYYDASLRCGW